MQAISLLPLAQSVASAKSWDEATRAIMLAGKHLPIVESENRTSERRIAGCESQVYLARQDDANGTYSAWSDSKIIRGVLAVLLEKVNQLSSTQRCSYDFEGYLHAAGLQRHLSASRANGMREVIKTLQKMES